MGRETNNVEPKEKVSERIVEANLKLERLKPVRHLLTSEYISVIQKEEFFVKALQLASAGLTVSEISRKLGFPYYDVYHWIEIGNEPLGKLKAPDFRYTKDFVDVLAAANTDASVDKDKIELSVIDYDLAKKFANALSNILGERVELKPYTRGQTGYWVVSGSSGILCNILNLVREQPTLAYTFLATDDLKKEYVRLFFAYDGGVSVSFEDKTASVRLESYAFEDLGRLRVVNDILSEFGVQTSGPQMVPDTDNCYRIRIEGRDDLELFANQIGIKGYKGEKLRDGLFLLDRMDHWIEDRMSRRESYEMAQSIWETYYVRKGGIHGYVPKWFENMYEIVCGEDPPDVKLTRVEEIYEKAMEDGMNLRWTLRY